MPPILLTRRSFCSAAAATCLTPLSAISQEAHQAAATSRPNVAVIDHDRILAAANRYLTLPPTPLTTLPSPRNPGTPHDFFSERDPAAAAQPSAPAISSTPPFSAHRHALFNLAEQVSTLIAASVLPGTSTDAPSPFAAHAAAHLRAWFVDPATRMSPSLALAGTGTAAVAVSPSTTTASATAVKGSNPYATPGNPEALLDAAPLAELAHALPFLAASDALTAQDSAALKSWFADYLRWLNESRLAALARDRKDRVASSWLLQAAALALYTGNEAVLSDLRHRFKSVTLRAQMNAAGAFPHELTTLNPLRNSLFNLDLLAAACDLLSTRFETLWDFELQDGPGLRSVLAFHFPAMQNRGSWPYAADASHFGDLPGRRIALLLAARAYTRPEYATLWSTLNPDPAAAEILHTLPVRQPLLWTIRPRPAAL